MPRPRKELVCLFAVCVYGFIRAAQLDGNPVEGSFTRAELLGQFFQFGQNLADYFDVRPVFANGKAQLEPGNCQQ